jgi:hypothetical protein
MWQRRGTAHVVCKDWPGWTSASVFYFILEFGKMLQASTFVFAEEFFFLQSRKITLVRFGDAFFGQAGVAHVRLINTGYHPESNLEVACLIGLEC